VVLVAYWALMPTSQTSDAYAYWAIDPENLYPVPWGQPAAYVYSPAFAQFVYPLTFLPWELFAKLLLGLNLVALAWLLGPAWAALALVLLPVSSELAVGNIHLLLAVMIVVGIRRPGAWAIGFLTKLTPGAVGVLWFAGRREWRSLGIALGVTAAIVAVSVLIWPAAWWAWIDTLSGAGDQGQLYYSISALPLSIRLFAAAVLAVLAGWRNRPAALPLIVLLALPTIWFSALVLIAAVPRLLRPIAPAPDGARPPGSASRSSTAASTG
jgi:hypothetical protein